MKNNRGAVNEHETSTLLAQIGDPQFNGSFAELEDVGERSIVLLDLTNPEHVAAYEELFNNPEKYEVVEEDDHSGRYSVYVVVRYVRKGPWRIKLSAPPSRKKSARSSKKPRSAPKRARIGFDPQKSSR